MVAPGNPVLKGFKGLILEFDDLPAVEADQMVMVAPLRGPLVSGFSVCEFSLGRQSQVGEKLQGPVDGRIADFRIGPWPPGRRVERCSYDRAN